ncbi:MAG: hypothetical protein MZV65_50355 [Chromatiales bacterium]|nr:hypothetical protein [Chromatiales bacterium]
MQALIKFFVELCLLRRPPQDLPASEMLLGLVLAADLVVGLLVGITAGLSWLTSLLQGVAEVLLTMTALYVALTQLKLRARFLQSATALLGSGAVLGLVAIPPLSLNPTGSQENDLAALGAFMLLGLVIWGLLVTAHILETCLLHHAWSGGGDRRGLPDRHGHARHQSVRHPLDPRLDPRYTAPIPEERPHASTHPWNLRHLHGRYRAAGARAGPSGHGVGRQCLSAHEHPVGGGRDRAHGRL